MRSTGARVGIAVAAVAAAVALFVVLGGDEDEGGTAATTPTATATTPAIEKIIVRNGKPVGGVQELEFRRGEPIRFTVDSDVKEEIHVHGYDLTRDVAAGGSVSFDFPATIDGVFEVELEQRGVEIAELTVRP